MKIKIFTDGGSRGNPGVAGFGLAVIGNNNQIIYKNSKYLGVKTNNEAEYAGLIFGLDWVAKNEKKMNIDEVEFIADSELMIRQMQGKYKVKAPNLRKLNMEAKEILAGIGSKVTFKSILRELNVTADKLANMAMDNQV